MRRTVAALGLISLLVLPTATAKSESAGQGVFRACALLNSQDIELVQGEALKYLKGHESAQGGLADSQCYFGLATASKSISLSVTSAAPGKPAKAVRAFWDAHFHRQTDKGRKTSGAKRKAEEPGAEEGEESIAPTPVAGMGQEAYWDASATGGNLYVLQRDHFLRISVGGPDNQALKLKKSKTLAQKVLARF